MSFLRRTASEAAARSPSPGACAAGSHTGVIAEGVSWAAFDYRELCQQLFEQTDARFEIATVIGRRDGGVLTDRGLLKAPLAVDTLGWRRVLADEPNQPPGAPLSRGLEVHPDGAGRDLDVLDRALTGPLRLRLECAGRRRAAGGRSVL